MRKPKGGEPKPEARKCFRIFYDAMEAFDCFDYFHGFFYWVLQFLINFDEFITDDN